MKQATKSAKHIRRRERRQSMLTLCVLIAVGLFIALSAVMYVAQPTGDTLRLALIVSAAIVYIWSFSTLVADSFTIGMIGTALTAALLCTLSFCDIAAKKGGAVFRLYTAVAALLSLYQLVFIGVKLAMLIGSMKTARSVDKPLTVVILGARTKGLEPGRMLKKRLDAAIKYMKAHNSVKCIPSGGMGDDEEASEAEIMKNYLLDHGITEDRIYMEDLSATTYENLSFSKAIAKSNGLPLSFAIATDRFHQLRSRLICRDIGIKSCCINAETVPYLAVQFWSREVLCLFEKLIKRL